MKSSEVLEKALELLGPNGEHWTVGTSYRDEHGDAIYREDPKRELFASCCVSAAIVRSEAPKNRHYSRSRAWKLFEQVIGSKDVPEWNDAPERSWPEVRAAFLKAIELAKSEESSVTR